MLVCVSWGFVDILCGDRIVVGLLLSLVIVFILVDLNFGCSLFVYLGLCRGDALFVGL